MTLALSAPARRVSWPAMTIIIIGNLIPIFGVRFLGWDAAQILILYWAENLTIGLLTIPRILGARGDETTGGDRLGLAAFFMVHYGFFWLIHGVFAWSLAGDLAEQTRTSTGVWAGTFGTSEFRWALLGLVFMQAVAFVREWRLSGRWRTAMPRTEMFRPYGRLIVLHLTVLVGAWSLLELGAPASTVLLLCVGKMLMELLTEGAAGLMRKPAP